MLTTLYLESTLFRLIRFNLNNRLASFNAAERIKAATVMSYCNAACRINDFSSRLRDIVFISLAITNRKQKADTKHGKQHYKKYTSKHNCHDSTPHTERRTG